MSRKIKLEVRYAPGAPMGEWAIGFPDPERPRVFVVCGHAKTYLDARNIVRGTATEIKALIESHMSHG